jgi:hypothetical protein
MLDTLLNYLSDSGFGHFHWTNAVMIGVGLLFIGLAIRKGFEPLLLVPIGFGILIGNVPYDASKLPLGVHDGPVSEDDLSYYQITGREAGDPPPTTIDTETELLALLTSPDAPDLALVPVPDPVLAGSLAARGRVPLAPTCCCPFMAIVNTVKKWTGCTG